MAHGEIQTAYELAFAVGSDETKLSYREQHLVKVFDKVQLDLRMWSRQQGSLVGNKCIVSTSTTFFRECQQSIFIASRRVCFPHCDHEARQAFNASTKHTELLKLVHNHSEIIQNVIECSNRLRNHAQFDCVSKVLRGDNCNRYYLHEISITRCEEFQITLGFVDVPLVFDNAGNSAGCFFPFNVFATIECNGFGIFADPNKKIT
mmetsp:Transcript_20731/g.46038  ORF Transcript_20731/g.46038 Transcript_20731/m.46038 type:complete len:205 (+) Transcript_20731:665-1279(+)